MRTCNRTSMQLQTCGHANAWLSPCTCTCSPCTCLQTFTCMNLLCFCEPCTCATQPHVCTATDVLRVCQQQAAAAAICSNMQQQAGSKAAVVGIDMQDVGGGVRSKDRDVHQLTTNLWTASIRIHETIAASLSGDVSAYGVEQPSNIGQSANIPSNSEHHWPPNLLEVLHITLQGPVAVGPTN